MTRLTDLEYLQLGRFKKFWYKFRMFWIVLFPTIGRFFVNIWKKITRGFWKVIDWFKSIYTIFAKGDWKTRLSYVIWGFGSYCRGQWLRGLLFTLFEVLFIVYMVLWGGMWLRKLFYPGHIGEVEVYYIKKVIPGIGEQKTPVYTDDSVQILLMGLLTLSFIIAAIYTWYVNIKQQKIAEEILASGKKVKSAKQDLKSLVDEQFHKTLLALPVTGIMLFTVLPIVYMICVAFTTYDVHHDGRTAFFSWVGFENFGAIFTSNTGSASMSATFGAVLLWTLIWAFFATFSNYFLGMLVAMMINKKGIKLKKLWRGVLVLSSAVPQFISLLYISNMFADSGLINGLFTRLGWPTVKFWTDTQNPNIARVTVIIINIWIGIPYLMLITSGVLMNIPADLYESARIDGANPWQQLVKITVPYMFFVTGPYLLTSFTGNLNNFNVIYLLSGGGPDNTTVAGTKVGHSDLLITWLFKMAIGQENDYKNASVIGIMIFVIVAFLSLVVYNLLPSNKNEEDFS